jgi:hypothetical protein
LSKDEAEELLKLRSLRRAAREWVDAMTNERETRRNMLEAELRLIAAVEEAEK